MSAGSTLGLAYSPLPSVIAISKGVPATASTCVFAGLKGLVFSSSAFFSQALSPASSQAARAMYSPFLSVFPIVLFGLWINVLACMLEACAVNIVFF